MSEESQFREIVIIGAGVCGIYMLHKMRSLGLDAVALERAVIWVVRGIGTVTRIENIKGMFGIAVWSVVNGTVG
ncbi:MAG: hypothetical protein QF515_07240 [Pseudomonadales bacterium]|nr:hypothetical protein [Pseudomonadales bacterium]MDP6469992.1 hypothetical protein [Pseudomonadales bacterium]MDP6826892.1 hypothetical protein [Pseudomonadales bacterium]